MKQQSLFVRVLIASNLFLLSFVVFIMLSSFKKENNNTFKEITAERINIVNEDGTQVIAISNKQRIANPVMGGKKYAVETSDGREHMAGMIFFNDQGDEMGGLVFNSGKLGDRNYGIGHLSFDRYNDNQVISLEHNENRSGVKTGITFYDRPGDGTFKTTLDLLEEKKSTSTTPERKAQINTILKEMAARKAMGSERVFLGSKNEVAQLELKDKKGKVRGRFYVDDKGAARIEFLGENGEVISVFPK